MLSQTRVGLEANATYMLLGNALLRTALHCPRRALSTCREQVGIFGEIQSLYFLNKFPLAQALSPRNTKVGWNVQSIELLGRDNFLLNHFQYKVQNLK